MVIDTFADEYEFLSNFSSYGFYDEKGRYWKTVEHYFQAMKIDPKHPDWEHWFYKVHEAKSPRQAKSIGRKCPLREDWEDLKVLYMYKALKMKFNENALIRTWLINTGDITLIEGNTWGDRYWGKDDGIGKNMLGRLLMTIREEYILTRKRP